MAEKCPHCNAEIDCYSAWAGSDYNNIFRYVCGKCDGIVEIIVDMVPEFRIGKPKCEWCNKTVDCTKPYCDDCQAKLSRCSK